jgi:phosphoglycolate phosphatase
VTEIEPVRAVLLDLDGTLIDPGRGVFAAITAATTTLGLPSPNEALLRRFIGPPIQEGFAELLSLNASDVQVAVAAFRKSYTASGLHDFDVYPGIPEMLADLVGAGFRLAVATSKPTPFATRVLWEAGLLSAFHSVHGATMDGAVRHKAQVAAAALHQLAAPADQAVLLGDRAHDVLGARACGTKCIGAAWGYGQIVELQEAGVDVIAASPRDVICLLQVGSRDPQPVGGACDRTGQKTSRSARPADSDPVP